jgi:hypothetical protein
MTGRGCAPGAIGVSSAEQARRRWALIVLASVAFGLLAAAVRAGDQAASGAKPKEPPAITLEIPHPALVIDRITSPRIQHSLELLPQYRKFRQGPQFHQLQDVVTLVAGRLGMTWDRALRELTGGGIVATLSAEPGREPRIEVIVTARDPKLLGRLNDVLLELARQDAKNKKMPDPVRTSDYRGTVVHVLGGEKTLAYAIVSGRLAIANATGDLERLIDRLQSKAPDPAKPAPAGSQARDDGDVILRGHVDVDRLRELDPKKFTLPERPDPGIVFLLGSWYQALKRARALDATLRWSQTELAADVDLPLPKDARPASVKGYLPEAGHGAMPALKPPGTIASLSLWRDWATIWESRAELFKPEVVQGFAQLDTVAGQFFQTREFGDVLGAFDPHWRLVVAQQDYAAMKPAPDQKLPAFAIVAELNGSQEDFAARLKIAFQTLVAISNVESAQKKGPVFELGSEVVDGVTIATTKYLVSPQATSSSEPGAQRYNYSPSVAQVGRHFVLSSSAGLARSLVKELKSIEASGQKPKDEPATFTVEADGPELARLLYQNRSRMVMNTMLSRGDTKPDAEGRVGWILDLFRYLGHGRLVVTDTADRTRLQLKLDLGR